MTAREEAAARVAEPATRTRPYLIGVRHHSPALAVAVPRLLDAAAAEVVCVELPADFQPWLPYLSDPRTTAPVALTGAYEDGRLRSYPLADFSPELAAIRWARERGAEVICADLPLTAPQWPAGADACARPAGPDEDDLWDRTVESSAPGSTPEAVRRAALAVGRVLRRDRQAHGGVAAVDLAREAHMRRAAVAAAKGRRVAAVIGAFHVPGLTGEEEHPRATAPADGLPAGRAVVTSLVPYAFALLDPRSGYPAGVRDPRWRQAVLDAGGDPGRIRDAAARVITELCREIRASGHTAGTGEAIETLRLACDLGALRGLPAPGRSELLEAVTSVLGRGEPLGRVLEPVLVGTERGRLAPGTPRCGLGPWVEAELASLRMPCPGSPARRELRLQPLRSALDARREILLQRLGECGVGYAEPAEVSATGDGSALTTRWRAAWTPAVVARLELVGVRGVTAAQAADGTLRENHRRASRAAGGATPAQVIGVLGAAARCALPVLVGDCLTEAARSLPAAATLPELLHALDLLDSIWRGHLPGTTERIRVRAAGVSETVLEAAVRALPGLAGSDEEEDALAIVTLAVRSGEERLGLRLDGELYRLSTAGSGLVQGASLAARVLLGLDGSDLLGRRLAGWVDTATGADTRRRLERRLTGVLIGAGPLMEYVPTALEPLFERVETIGDRDFLDRLPALRGGFRALTRAGRGRLLAAVTDRLGHRPGLRLPASAELVGRGAEADHEGLAALRAVGLDGLVSPSAPARTDTGAPSSPHTEDPAPDRPAPGAARIRPADRWRLLLGRDTAKLPPGLVPYAWALDELFGTDGQEGQDGQGGTEDGEGAGGGDQDGGAQGGDRAAPADGRTDGRRADGGRTGGRGPGFPSARHWAERLEALFGADVREEVLGRAVESGRTDVIAHLDPASVRPSVELLSAVLSLARGMPEQRMASLRPLVRRLIDDLTRELATRLRPTLTGLTSPRPTRRPGGRLDLPRTLRANLTHTRRLEDGSVEVIPERPVFTTRTARENDWRLILVVDVSASMESSVVWSAITAAVLGGAPMLSTHFLAFGTQVVDLTDRVADPLSLLLEVRVGGGTHIAAGVAHARTLVRVPNRTLMVVVSDFEEGAAIDGLLAEVRAVVFAGVQVLGCAALDGGGVPRYSVPVTRQLVAAGMPVAALSPLSLARWVGERVRGATR
ncbi:DUF5682 family protein [Streptomyces sp. NPDC017260]|uniref:DUF5682 family protein n=1 Tax=unclassified Streptomyces TaxID=2593676 RepID=UPI0037B16442